MKIVITGAADGLGRELARKLSDNKLVLIDYAEDKLKEVAKEHNCEYYVCDLSSSEQVEKTCNEILKNNEDLDVLINCAGAWVNERAELNLSKLRNMILVNVFGTRSLPFKSVTVLVTLLNLTVTSLPLTSLQRIS